MNLKDLHPYQTKAIEHIFNNSHSALLMDMGLGKTICTLTAISKLMYEELEITKVLIIAPKRVVESVWTQEAATWEHTRHLTFSKVTGSPTERMRALHRKADIYLISRDNIVWLCTKYNTSGFDMCIIDELSSFKNIQSKRFRALRSKRDGFSRIVGLTGTPAPNSLMDLWGPVFLLDRGERLGKTISSYRWNYFHKHFFDYTLRKGAREKIHSLIADICISMKAEDYLQLPESIDNIVRIEFPEKLQKDYDYFKNEAVLELVDKDITAINSAVLANKLLQFSNGGIYDEQKVCHEVHSLKLDAASEIIADSSSEPVLIAWTYRFDRDRLLERFPNAVELKTDKDIVRWNKGEIPVFLMHPASGGHGLNLQSGGCKIIWFGQTWSLELYQQLNARLHRQGQKKAVIIHHLIISGTMDTVVMKRLKSKDKGQKALMEATKAMVAEAAQLEAR